MSFTDMLRRTVFVDDRQVETAESTTAADLIRSAGQKPDGRTLVQSNPDGTTELIPGGRRIKLRDGQRFETQLDGFGGG